MSRPASGRAMGCVMLCLVALAGVMLFACAPCPLAGPGAAEPFPSPGSAGPGQEGDTAGSEPEEDLYGGSSVVTAPLETLVCGGAVAAGPFASIRGFGWTSEAQGWAYATPTGQPVGAQHEDLIDVFITLGGDGTGTATEMTNSDASSIAPLLGNRGFLRSYQRRIWYYPFDGSVVYLGSDVAVTSPSGKWILRFDQVTFEEGVATLYDALTLEATPQPAIPFHVYESPCQDIRVTWLGEDLVLTSDSGLVAIPEGNRVGRVSVPGMIVVPAAAANGSRVAFLAIEEVTAVWPESYPHDYAGPPEPVPAGQELHVFDKANLLLAPAPTANSVLRPGHGLVAAPVWSDDGCRLAYTVVSGIQPGVSRLGTGEYLTPTRVEVASFPTGDTVEVPVDPGLVWTAVSFSPDNRYLLLVSGYPDTGEARSAVVWSSVTGAVLDLDALGLTGVEGAWVGPATLVAVEYSTGMAQPVFLRVDTGQVQAFPYSGKWTRIKVRGDGQVIAVTEVPPGVSLGEFGEVAPGFWLVRYRYTEEGENTTGG